MSTRLHTCPLIKSGAITQLIDIIQPKSSQTRDALPLTAAQQQQYFPLRFETTTQWYYLALQGCLLVRAAQPIQPLDTQ